MGEAPEKFIMKKEMTQEEENEMIDKLTKKKVPRKRKDQSSPNSRVGNESHMKSSRRHNNLPKAPLPPKRIRQDDTSDLFPALAIEGSE